MTAALIFDFDGVIINSEPHWQRLEAEWFSELVPNWTKEKHAHIVGTPMHDTHTYLQKNYNIQVPLDEFLEKYRSIGTAVYAQSEVLSGAPEFIAAAAEHWPLGIATSSNATLITSALERFGLQDYFCSITTADDIPANKGKPDPTIYLLAAERMRVEPRTCIVLEDAMNGVKAAKAAGMYCIGIQGESIQDLSEADRVVQNYDELHIESLLH